MTKRVTVSLPDDVAAYLGAQPNASAVVAEALRATMNRREIHRLLMASVGINLTEEGAARWRGKLPPPTEAQKAANRRALEEMRAGTFDPAAARARRRPPPDAGPADA